MDGPSLTASSLTDILRRAGGLAGGAVLDVQVDRQLETWVSELAFIRVTYSTDAPPDLPHGLVVKWPPAAVSWSCHCCVATMLT